MNRFLLLIFFVGAIQGCSSVTQFEKLDEKYQQAQYEKVLNKADKLIKSNPADPIPFYFKSMTQLFLYAQTNRPEQLILALQNLNRTQQKRIPDYLSEHLENLTGELLIAASEAITKYEGESPEVATKIKALVQKITHAEKPEIIVTPDKPKEPQIVYHHAEGIRAEIVETAQKFKGTPYRYGGTTSNGFDCSGFTSYVFAQAGITIPRTAAQQAASGLEVNKHKIKPGDLVFFSKMPQGAGINHVALILESGTNGIKAVIHSTSRGVVVDNISGGAWKSYWAPRVKTIATYIND